MFGFHLPGSAARLFWGLTQRVGNYDIERKGSGLMLRRDTLYMVQSNWEPKVPAAEVMQKQVKKRQMRLAGSVRAALGKLIGEKNVSLKTVGQNRIR